MVNRWWVRAYRIIFAALALVAVAYQFWHSRRLPGFRPANFFSFFTIESNLFAAVILLWVACRPSDAARSDTANVIRGAAVLYLSITGVVYGLLLAGYQAELQLTLPWVDVVLHRIMPLVLVADWLIDPPSNRLGMRRALIWLVYPVLFAAYSLIRGPIVNWYPYPFLDPRRVGGYGIVALYCLGIAVGTVLFTGLVLFVGERVRLIPRGESVR